jgi:hypothetical protein
MTVLLGDTGRTAHGTLKTFTFGSGVFDETVLSGGSIITLPNAEGATNQISFTVRSDHLPTISPSPVSVKYTACIVASGKAVTAATPSYRVLKNGASVATSAASAVTANTYYTNNHFRWFDIQIGDVLDVRMWSNQIDTTLEYFALVIYPTSFYLTKQDAIMKDLVLASTNGINTLIGKSAVSVGGTGNTNMYPSTTPSSSFSFSGGAFTFPVFVQSSTNGLYRVQFGDNNTAITQNYSNATSIPQQQKCFIPSTITFREVLR